MLAGDPIAAYRAEVAAAVESVRARIEAALARAGRPSGSVELMAVTKLQPAEAVAAAMAADVRSFGENRVQEAEAKFSALGQARQGLGLHMIGHLQGNKAGKAAALFDCVQSIDSRDILIALDRRAGLAGRTVDVLFELRTGEESKSGFVTEAELLDALEFSLSLANLRPRGLMTMAPFTVDEGDVRGAFRACARAFERAGRLAGSGRFDTLSMGMSGDFEIAIEEGSTMVRVGTALFGRRDER